MSNEELLEYARRAIDKVFSDRTVTVGQTKENLGDLMSHIYVMLESLEE
jgi:hypothetical protein